MLPENLEGTVLENDLMILRRLGEGGMGVVYAASQPRLGRTVCVKFLRSELVSDEEHLKRFQREVRAMSTLATTEIARIYSVGSFLGVYPYIVMELVEGVTLRELISASKIKPEEVCRLFIHICRSLSIVHEHGFVHRDLKPENIMVWETSDGFEVKILDFGLCGLLQGRDESVTRTAELLGSFFYMAPECFTSAQYSPAVDIYALGCIMYEVLAGAPPFCPGVNALFAHLHSRESFPKLPRGNVEHQSVIPAVQSVLEKACSKSAKARYQSTEEFAVSLENVLRGCQPSSLKRNSPNFRTLLVASLIAGPLLLLMLCEKDGLKVDGPDPTQTNAMKRRLEACQNQAGKLVIYRDFLTACHCRKEIACDWTMYQASFEHVFADTARKGNLQEAFALSSDCFSWISKRTSATNIVYQRICISKAESALALGRYSESEHCIELLDPNKYPKQFDISPWVRANLIFARALARQNKGEQAAEVLNSCIGKLFSPGANKEVVTDLGESVMRIKTTGTTKLPAPRKIPPIGEAQLRLTLSEILVDLKRLDEARTQVETLKASGWRSMDWASSVSSYMDFYKTVWLGATMEHFELNAVYYQLAGTTDQKEVECLWQAIALARSGNLIIDESRLKNRYECLYGTSHDPLSIFHSLPPLVWKDGILIKSPSVAQIDHAILCLRRLKAPQLVSELCLQKAQCLVKVKDFKGAKELAQAVISAGKGDNRESAWAIIRHCDNKLQEK